MCVNHAAGACRLQDHQGLDTYFVEAGLAAAALAGSPVDSLCCVCGCCSCCCTEKPKAKPEGSALAAAAAAAASCFCAWIYASPATHSQSASLSQLAAQQAARPWANYECTALYVWCTAACSGCVARAAAGL